VEKILSEMGKSSTCIVYGALALKNFKYNPITFIEKQHVVSFFWMGVWMASLTNED